MTKHKITFSFFKLTGESARALNTTIFSHVHQEEILLSFFINFYSAVILFDFSGKIIEKHKRRHSKNLQNH